MRRIGSTDIASIVAFYKPELAYLSKKKTAADTWLRLTHGIDLPRSPVMGRGLRVEPLLRDLYRQSVGPISEAPGIIQHPKHEWMTASPDGYAPVALVELKTASRWIQNRWGPPGSDILPADYQLQVMHLLEVTGRRLAHVLCAFGDDGKDENGEPTFTVTETAGYVAHYDAELVASMVECGERFWHEFVLTKTPPPIRPLHNIRRWNALLKQQQTTEATHG